MLRPIALSIALSAALAGPALAGPALAGPALAGPALAEPAGERWALDAVNAEKAWKVTRGEGVTVAVLGAARPDGGIPELKDKVLYGPDMTGRVFGGLVPGDAETALASLVAGSGRDGGIAGVAPGARVMSIPVAEPKPDGNFLEPEAETGVPQDRPVARGIRYAANHGATVICLPISDYGVDRTDREAISYALSRGVVLVASVGDGGQSEYAQRTGTSYWRFPAGYPGVVGVAAADRQGRKAAWSSDNLSVLVAAPGVDVPVALAGGSHGTISGTPVSTALVAGIAALIKAKYPDMAPELISRALTSTSRPRPRAGYDDKVGFGVVDAAAALTKAAELAGYSRTVPVRDDLHFGKGPVSEGPARPGPDPVRLWIYAIAVVLGLGGFAAGAVALSRR